MHLPSRQSTFFGQVSSLFLVLGLPVCVVVVVVVLPTQNAGALTGLVLASQVFHFQFSVFHSPRDLVSNTVVSSMIDICCDYLVQYNHCPHMHLYNKIIGYLAGYAAMRWIQQFQIQIPYLLWIFSQ